MTPYYQQGLCPVNVHWHLGAEHLSVGEYDDHGYGPYDKYALSDDDDHHRQLAAGGVRLGGQCHFYDEAQEKYTKEYDWQHCVDMQVGQTYEIHWPHSTVGACNTPYQYQTPFYDGVFCNFMAAVESMNGTWPTTHDNVGVQAQVFTVVNDESYYYPDLFKGMIVAGDYGDDIAYYTGSTTGTSRSNTVCSAYSPITWQVDRKCHLISASSFDKLCADMRAQVDDMTADLYAHGESAAARARCPRTRALPRPASLACVPCLCVSASAHARGARLVPTLGARAWCPRPRSCPYRPNRTIHSPPPPSSTPGAREVVTKELSSAQHYN